MRSGLVRADHLSLTHAPIRDSLLMRAAGPRMGRIVGSGPLAASSGSGRGGGGLQVVADPRRRAAYRSERWMRPTLWCGTPASPLRAASWRSKVSGGQVPSGATHLHHGARGLPAGGAMAAGEGTPRGCSPAPARCMRRLTDVASPCCPRRWILAARRSAALCLRAALRSRGQGVAQTGLLRKAQQAGPAVSSFAKRP